MRTGDDARIAVIGAGPGGLATAKYALEAGLTVTVFEASDDLGGQWHTAAEHSGVWPGMQTNTSRALTAFSDFPVPASHGLYPYAVQVHDYLRAYAGAFDVTPTIRFGTTVHSVTRDREVDGEAFDAVVVATGRFHAPRIPPALGGFSGELLHAYDYPGAAAFQGRRVLVFGNGVSGHEIASDIAAVTPVISAYRKPRYVLQKLVDGVPSDGQWYTHVGALRRRALDRQAFGRDLRRRVLAVAGNPADFGAPEPDPDILIAGQSLCQDFLRQVRDGPISCRPGLASANGRTVRFTDGTATSVDAVICATGYDLSMPCLAPDVWDIVGPTLRLHQRTIHPDLPGMGFVGMFPTTGPYFPLLELQARWLVGVFTGAVSAPLDEQMRASVAADPPAVDSHDALALMFSESAGVSPNLARHSELLEPLLFGPMVPARYRLDGPGALPDAASRFEDQFGACPRAPVDPIDVALLPNLIGPDLAAAI